METFPKFPDGADHIPVLVPPDIEPANVTEPPEQTDWADPALTTAAGFTVTTTLAELIQPAVVSV